MKKINIGITREELEDMVRENTAYTAAKLEEEGRGEKMERIAAVDADTRLLSRLLRDASGKVGERLRDHVTEQSYDGNTLRLELEVGNCYDETSAAGLKAALGSALAGYVTGRWMRLACPAKAAEWEHEGADQTEVALRLLLQRRRPVRVRS